MQDFEKIEDKIAFYKKRSPKEKLDWLYEANRFQKMVSRSVKVERADHIIGYRLSVIGEEG